VGGDGEEGKRGSGEAGKRVSCQEPWLGDAVGLEIIGGVILGLAFAAYLFVRFSKKNR
jgi:hypothetical protein